MVTFTPLRAASAGLALITAGLMSGLAVADNVILDDLIVDGSLCTGLDCVNGESFGFDTIRLKENNLRIKFQDTSTSASFPSNDWQITINDSSNGGANKFSIDDISGGRTPFTIEAGAPTHSLFVDDGGRLGLGTATPVVEAHIVDGDTPTVRLEQNGSSGFTPQTWDMAGNETNFFIRDATNGSKLVFRIKPDAPSNSVFVDTNGNVGFGTSSPDQALDIEGDSATLRLTETQSGREWDIRVDPTNGRLVFDCSNGSGTGDPECAATTGAFKMDPGAQENLVKVGFPAADAVLITGNLVISGTCSSEAADCASDYVFEPDYALTPLGELEKYVTENKHLPGVPSADEFYANGINLRDMDYKLLEKIEELVLYTLQQQKIIDSLHDRLAELEEKDQ